MIHPSAEVLTEQIGKETQIWQNVIILKEAKIGNNCNINCNCFIENKVVIGDNVTIKVGVSIWDNTHIGDNVFIGPNATFTNDMIPRSKVYPSKFLKTIVENNASIGANSTLIGGNKIGAYSMIGAGSVVTKPVPPFSVWYGNPAKQKGFITREGVMLGIDLVDKEGNKYKLVNGEPIIE
jgi:UDP-2-acetamido-3-amino-2,3-dideoxy-glucuronate N-acetyltransferase